MAEVVHEKREEKVVDANVESAPAAPAIVRRRNVTYLIEPRDLYCAIGVVAVDICIVCLLVGAICGLTSSVTPPHLPFFCVADVSHRFVPLSNRFVTFKLFVCVAVATAIIPIIIMEAVHVYVDDFLISESRIVSYLYGLYRYAGSCLVGLVLNVALCLLVKYTVMQPAPNFMATCQPDIDLLKLIQCVRLERVDIVDAYSCVDSVLDVDLFDMPLSRMSFYSIYCSCSMHCAAFAVLYLQIRVHYKIFGHSLRPFMQLLLLPGPLTIGYLREVERFISPLDMAVGFLAGTVSGIFSAVCTAHVFSKSTMEVEESEVLPMQQSGAPASGTAGDPQAGGGVEPPKTEDGESATATTALQLQQQQLSLQSNSAPQKVDESGASDFQEQLPDESTASDASEVPEKRRRPKPNAKPSSNASRPSTVIITKRA